MAPADLTIAIELARPEDLASLPEIERAAGAMFAGWDVALEADPQPMDLGELARAQRAGHVWVARSDSGEVAGFALVDLIDGQPHLEEMDVSPAFARRGIGRRLLEAVAAWGRAAGHSQLTLTTFRDIPWNAPFYASAGFRELRASELSVALRERVREEAARGLEPATRAVMSRALG